MYKEVLKRERRKKKKLNAGAHATRGDESGSEEGDEEEDAEGSDDEELEERPQRMDDRMQKQKQTAQEPSQESTLRGEESQDMIVDSSTGVSDGSIRPERFVHFHSIFETMRNLTDKISRLDLFRQRLARLYATTLQDDDFCPLDRLVQLINEGLPTETLFGTAEITAACEVMVSEEKLFVSDGIVYKI